MIKFSDLKENYNHGGFDDIQRPKRPNCCMCSTLFGLMGHSSARQSLKDTQPLYS